jgi:hypothetical protein
MTYFLNNPVEPTPPRGPDVAPPSSGIGTLFQKMQLEGDVSFRAIRERSVESKGVAQDAGKRLDLNEVIKRGRERGLYAKGEPKTLDEAMAMDWRTGPLVMEMSREAAAAVPEKWKDLDLTEEGIDARVNQRLQAEYAELNDLLALSPKIGAVTQFLVGAAAVTADVKNIPFLFMGGGTGSILKVMGREAAINTAAETASLPGRFEMADRLGTEAPNVGETLAMAAVGGAAFGGALEGILRAPAGLRRAQEYYRNRQKVEVPKGADPAPIEAAIDAVEDALVAGEPPAQALGRLVLRAEERVDVAPARPLEPPRTEAAPAPASFDELMNASQRGKGEPSDLTIMRAPEGGAVSSAQPDPRQDIADANSLLTGYRFRQDEDGSIWLSRDEDGGEFEAVAATTVGNTDRRRADMQSALEKAGADQETTRLFREEGADPDRDWNTSTLDLPRWDEVSFELNRMGATQKEIDRINDMSFDNKDIGPEVIALANKYGVETDLYPSLQGKARPQTVPLNTLSAQGRSGALAPPTRGLPAPDAPRPSEAASFDMGDKARADTFSDPTSPKAQEFMNAQVAQLRQSVGESEFDGIQVELDDGRTLSSLEDVLREIDELDAMSREIELCRLGKVVPDGNAG